MKRFLLFCLLFFAAILVNAQGTNSHLRKTIDKRRDTNIVVYDEQGNALRHYQYQKFVNTGWYGITKDGDANNPNTKRYLKRLSTEQHDKRVEVMKKAQTLNSPYLKENLQLDLEPLGDKVSAKLIHDKVILLVFWAPGSSRSADIFAELNEFLKDLQNLKDLQILLITRYNWEGAVRRLDETPLLNAKLIADGESIIGRYGVRSFNAYVVADKNLVIRHAVSGYSGMTAAALKKTITTLLAE